MSATLLHDDSSSMLSTILTEAAEPLYIVNPSHETISELVSTLQTVEHAPSVRMLADERALKDVMDDFLVASTAADLIEADQLSLRVLEAVPNHSIAVTPETVHAIVELDDQASGLGTDDEAFVNEAYEQYSTKWSNADVYSLRTPPLSRVQTTLESDIGPETATDFDSVLSSLTTARGDGDGLDEVTISLLVAARNGELLYDISKWGEDIGLASKATFSRTKTKLEDMGLIDTEKVPIDVGRPRLRLLLGDERLEDAEADELATVAQSILAA